MAAVAVAGAAPAGAATGWTLTTVPNPTSVQTFLEGVSCRTTAAGTPICAGVGNFLTVDGILHTLAERWNGTSWSFVGSPIHTGALASTLEAVSCTSPASCLAVGSYRASVTAPTLTLAERWNGSGWSIVPSANVSGATGNFLNGVSCVSATSCWAVGYSTSAFTTGAVLTEHWNGTKWSIVASPNKSSVDSLAGVSCLGGLTGVSCMAVGTYSGSTGVAHTLAERWNGSRWVILATPNQNTTHDNVLQGVSCPAANTCLAVGVWQHSPGATLAERWNGSGWSIVPTANPAGFTFAQLEGVTCPTTSSCFALGDSSTSATGTNVTLVEHWNGSSFGIAPSPNPAGKTANLAAVSCATTTACMAVGNWVNNSGASLPLAERH